jgi:hypothetical protein
MSKSIETGTKSNARAKLIATAVAVVFIVGFILAAYFVIEARIFRMITSQPGVTVKIGSRSGNLMSGYILRDLSVHQNASGDKPGSEFSTPKMVLHWRLRPMMVTGVSWDAAKFKLEPQGKQAAEFPISAGTLTLSTKPDEKGWLESDKPIIIGPDSWGGRADLGLRADGKQLRGKIHIDRLPMEYLSLATETPSGFVPTGDVVLDIDLSGTPQNPQVSGTVADPGTWKAFHF